MTKYYGYIPDNSLVTDEFINFLKHVIDIETKNDDQAIKDLFQSKWDFKAPSMSVSINRLTESIESAKNQMLSSESAYEPFRCEMQNFRGDTLEIYTLHYKNYKLYQEKTEKLKWMCEYFLRELKETETKVNQTKENINNLVQFFGYQKHLNLALELWDEKPESSRDLIAGDVIGCDDGEPLKLKYTAKMSVLDRDGYENTWGYIKHKTQNKFTEKERSVRLTHNNWTLLSKSDNWKYYNQLFQD